MIILKTNKVTKHFEGVHAVDRLSLSIEKATIVAIVGPNGSGKTTLVNVLTGMMPYDSGTVIISDTHRFKKIKPYTMYAYGLTRTFQEVRLFDQMSVLDNILVVLTQRKVMKSFFETQKSDYTKAANKILQKVGIWGKRNELAINLSYGQRKLLEIARALVTQAEIFLFDEPFAGLFPEMRKIVSHIVAGLKRKGKTVILIEHDMDVVRELSDYIYVMDSGKVLAAGAPRDVLNNKEVREAYLGT
ncbi:ABC transporter ATP-binding protein [Patescibacteria group bacterium AH-259-L05]|nr:ABC transporter ATP-binding protein [Patescibacteria group bacterium AH-259-L05]